MGKKVSVELRGTVADVILQHAAKYIDPKESGAVIPIVHVNGFKISERTIYGCMDDKEMVTLFTGYGYQPRFVEDLEDIVCFLTFMSF